MLEDNVRTTTYMEAIQQNRADFEGKVVVDVGAKLRAGVRAGLSVRVGVRLSVRFLRLGFGGRARVGARLGRMCYVRRACIGAGEA